MKKILSMALLGFAMFGANCASNSRRAVVVVDGQWTFFQLPVEGTDGKIQPTGSLGVANADERLRCDMQVTTDYLRAQGFFVNFTQDWHLPGHISFASTHPGKRAFVDTIVRPDGKVQQLWPDHGVQGTKEAEIALTIHPGDHVTQKGTLLNEDSYSGVQDDGGNKTDLLETLRKNDVTATTMYGIAYDYCVEATAVDLAKNGIKVDLILNLTAGVRLPGDTSLTPQSWLAATERLKKAGVNIHYITDIKSTGMTPEVAAELAKKQQVNIQYHPSIAAYVAAMKATATKQATAAAA